MELPVQVHRQLSPHFSGAGRVPDRLIKANLDARSALSIGPWSPSLAQSNVAVNTPASYDAGKISTPCHAIENDVRLASNQRTLPFRDTFFPVRSPLPSGRRCRDV